MGAPRVYDIDYVVFWNKIPASFHHYRVFFWFQPWTSQSHRSCQMTDGILLLELRSPLFFGRNIWCENRRISRCLVVIEGTCSYRLKLGHDGNEWETDIACCGKGVLWCWVHTIIIDEVILVLFNYGWRKHLEQDGLNCRTGGWSLNTWLQIIGSVSVSGIPTPQKLSTTMCFDNIGLLHMPKNFEQDANIAKGMKRPTH